MLNYEVEPQMLEPLVPRGTELDYFQGRTFISVVGFMFLDTRLLGLPIPFHRNFEEVNLRFYVRRRLESETRRGVVFVKELVPRWAIATVARWSYNEPYSALPMRHAIEQPNEQLKSVRYQWRVKGDWQGLQVDCEGQPQALAPGSQEEFIAEHYWGYCRQRNGSTVEYHVQHPPWRIHRATHAALDLAVAKFYGEPFSDVLSSPPTSAFVADGSNVVVGKPRRM
jgi:uncharacterized protein YqjF (DUF2071 family)